MQQDNHLWGTRCLVHYWSALICCIKCECNVWSFFTFDILHHWSHFTFHVEQRFGLWELLVELVSSCGEIFCCLCQAWECKAYRIGKRNSYGCGVTEHFGVVKGLILRWFFEDLFSFGHFNCFHLEYYHLGFFMWTLFHIYIYTILLLYLYIPAFLTIFSVSRMYCLIFRHV